MTNTPTTPDRIPLGHSVRYAVRGLPEVPNQYGPGTLEPREITITYRAAPDSQLGRVHAYVAGRIWVDGNELPLLPGGLYGQHYDDGLDGWPEWLAEEARLHDPTATRAVPVPPTTHAGDRAAVSTTLWAAAEHHTVAEWICCEPINPAHDLCAQGGPALQMLKALLVDDPEAWKPAPLLDEMMRLLPPTGSVAEAHRLALSEALDLGTGAPWDAIHERVQELRRMADEAQQQPDTQTPGCPDPIECSHEAALGQAEEKLDAVHALGTAWSRPSMSSPTRVAGEHLLRLLNEYTPGEQPVPGPGRVADEEQQPTRCDHSFPDPFPDPLDHIGNCRHCGISYQAAKAQRQESGTCGKTRGVDGNTYRPCARDTGHPEAYCRSADGSHLFLATRRQEA